MKIGFWFHMMYFLCLPKTLFILSRWSLMSPPRQRGRGNLGSASFIPWATCLKFQCFCKSCMPITPLRVVHRRLQQYNLPPSPPPPFPVQNWKMDLFIRYSFFLSGVFVCNFFHFIFLHWSKRTRWPSTLPLLCHVFYFKSNTFSIKVCIFSHEFSFLHYDVVASSTSLHHCGSCTSQDFWKPSHPLHLSSLPVFIKSLLI